MKVTKANIEISAVSGAQYPKTNLPEIALAGRSNVGKSSFINRIIGRKNLVRTSSKPGKTRTLNFYIINDLFYFVDVPGYGYAKVSKSEREKWGRMMEEYFETRDQLRVVILIVDIRHKPTREDIQMYEYITYLEIPLIIIATKLDKVPKNKRTQHIKQIKTTFTNEQVTIIPFSAETSENKELVWKEIKQYI
ncbi:ribosome biogenesis GTP-binding protein YihA/YsxC [Pseudogracilibacillus auburnensis]|uniref:Probable GTP-binding protein EngB n=1 Tax=Pseudogracilibacillus auburnensis TaxID=1494959 RepID=A0A2V3VXC7_9BACI|nr:ribosome biogenesis GTP-binding protein YihA/YsxC [Pseudogracilibacillus auburnensis]MBO1002624.1 YihA family ribosome biogenesis GTP-binding protein [Pseudogracilibacillus auburnensis]PXW86647.1 GTP-binding protein [Pseudogracilibacillus auburnensis]